MMLLSRNRRRRIVNVMMLGLTAVFTVVSLSILVFVLGYLVVNGGRSLNLAFFTELPRPGGETGGGMANALIGSAKMLGIAAVTGLPIGLLAGLYLSEFAGRTTAAAVRYGADLLNGMPSIVIGIFVYTMVVLPMKQFSTLAGGLALGVMMIPIMTRSTEEFLRAVPLSLREARWHWGHPAPSRLSASSCPLPPGGLSRPPCWAWLAWPVKPRLCSSPP
jgi:phosphate transport system permease protein